MEYDGEMPELIVRVRLHEGGKTFLPGDEIMPDETSHERLVFLIARDVITPHLPDLPEPLFTDVMEMRD